MLLDITFTEEEKNFFEIYQRALLKYHHDPEKFLIFLELKALDLGIENLQEVLEKFHSFLRKYLFFKSKRSELEKILPVKSEIIPILKKFPLFAEYRVEYTFPSEATYKGFKYRQPYIVARGSDGLVRIWLWEGESPQFLTQLGEKGSGWGAYELWKDYLFYGYGNRLKVYNFQTLKEIADIDIGSPAEALNIDQEGNLYLYKKVGSLAIRQKLEIEGNKVIFGPADPVAPTEVHGGEQDMLAKGQKLVRVLNEKIVLFSGKKKVEKLEFKPLTKYKEFAVINDVYPYKDYVVVATSGTSPQILNIRTAEKVATLDIPVTHSYRIAKNPARNWIAISHNMNLISVWDLDSLQPVKILESYFIDVLGVDFSPDGKYLIAAGEGRDINVWDTETWEMVKDIDLPEEGVMSVAFSPDGKYIAAGCGDYKIYLISTDNWEVEKTLTYHEDLISDLKFTPDGKYLISTSWDGKAVIWDIESGEVDKLIETSEERLWRLDISPDGNYVAIASWDGKLSLFKRNTWELIATYVQDAPVTAVKFSENYLVIGRRDGLIEVVEIVRKEEFDKGSIVDLSADPSENAQGVVPFEGNLLILTDKGRIMLWNSVGDKIFSAKVEGQLQEVENVKEPKLEVKVLPNTFILREDNRMFGGKGWTNYIQILEGNRPVKDKNPFVEEITDPSLVKEVA
jgi:WD40 repeat protein